MISTTVSPQISKAMATAVTRHNANRNNPDYHGWQYCGKDHECRDYWQQRGVQLRRINGVWAINRLGQTMTQLFSAHTDVSAITRGFDTGELKIILDELSDIPFDGRPGDSSRVADDDYGLEAIA